MSGMFDGPVRIGPRGGAVITIEGSEAPDAPVILAQDGDLLSGTGTVGKLLYVFLSSDLTTPIADTVVAGDGTWSVDVTDGLTQGLTYGLKAEQGVIVYSPPTPAFDFTVGVDWHSYSPLPTLQVEDYGGINPAGGWHYLKVFTDDPVNQTIYFQVAMENGTGPNYFYLGGQFDGLISTEIFTIKPGDDPFVIVPYHMFDSIGAADMTPAANVVMKVLHIWGCAGTRDGSIEFNIECHAAATGNVEPAAPTRRPVMLLNMADAPPPDVDLDIPAMVWGDNETGKWNTALSNNQRTQDGNGEYGLYQDHNDDADQQPHIITTDEDDNDVLILHSEKLAIPVEYGSVTKNYMASALNSQYLSEWCGRTFLLEIDSSMPNRLGSWPAKWFMNCNTSTRVGYWPFELDWSELFNYMSDTWHADEFSHGLHLGVPGSNVRENVVDDHVRMVPYGFTAYDTHARHREQIMITEDFITIFVEGVEVNQRRNYLHNTLVAMDLELFLILNIAVGGNDIGDPGDYDALDGDYKIWALRKWDDPTVIEILDAEKPYTDLSDTPPPSDTFSDDFNRADEYLNASEDWTLVSGAADRAQVISNQLWQQNSGDGEVFLQSPDKGSATQYVEAKISSGALASMLCAQASNQNNFVGFNWRADLNQINVYVKVGGSYTQICAYDDADGGAAVSLSDVWRLTVDGSTFSMKKNGVAQTPLYGTQDYSGQSVPASTRQGVILRMGDVVSYDDYSAGVA